MSEFLNLYIDHEDDPEPTCEEGDIQSETLIVNLEQVLYIRRVCQADMLLYMDLHFPGGKALRVTSVDYDQRYDPVRVLDAVVEERGRLLTESVAREET